MPLPLPLTIVADDLTGAFDAAVPFAGSGATDVVLQADRPWPEVAVLAVDTESRYLAEAEARRLAATAARRSLASGRSVFKKIDSTLRGHPGPEVAATLTALAPAGVRLAIVAPAFPATGRTTLGGVMHVHGRPTWTLPFGGSVTDAMRAGGLMTQDPIPASVDALEVARRLREAEGQGCRAVVADAVEEAHLDTILRASELLDFPTLLVGSGGLTRRLAAQPAAVGPPPLGLGKRPRVLFVVGSYSPVAQLQVQHLVSAGVARLAIRLGAALPPELRAGPAAGDQNLLLVPDASSGIEKRAALDVAAALGRAAGRIIDDFDAVVLTGGETARAAMEAVGASRARVLGELETGVVVSRAPGVAPLLVTKAGAFGSADTLVNILEALRTSSRNEDDA